VVATGVTTRRHVKLSERINRAGQARFGAQRDGVPIGFS